MSTDQGFWDSIERCRATLAHLHLRADQYLKELPQVRRLVERRDKAWRLKWDPRKGNAARRVCQSREQSVETFYAEFRAFTKEVLVAFDGLRGVLPEREVDAWTGKVAADLIESTCQAVLEAAKRAEEFCSSRPEVPEAATDGGTVAGTEKIDGTLTPEKRAEERAARKRMVQEYKNEGTQQGVKITDLMIAEAADQNWKSRTQIQKWKACDPRYSGGPDAKIRKILREKPHLRKDR